MTPQKLKAITLKSSVAVGALLTNPISVFAQAVDINEGIDIATPGDVDTSIGFFENDGLFERITSTLLLVVGALSVIMLIIGGIRYVVSAGDQNAVTGAKNTIMYAIVGIVVAFLAFTAVQFVVKQLSTA